MAAPAARFMRLKPFPKPVFTALASLNLGVEQRVQGDLAQCTPPSLRACVEEADLVPQMRS